MVLSDAGAYRCEAENLFNKTSESGILLVRRKTLIEQAPMDLEVNAGNDAKFTCSGTTDPEEVGSCWPVAVVLMMRNLFFFSFFLEKNYISLGIFLCGRLCIYDKSVCPGATCPVVCGENLMLLFFVVF